MVVTIATLKLSNRGNQLGHIQPTHEAKSMPRLSELRYVDIRDLE